MFNIPLFFFDDAKNGNISSLKEITKKIVISLALEDKIKIENIEKMIPSELFTYINNDFMRFALPITAPIKVIDLKGHVKEITSAYNDESNKTLYITGSDDKTARIWNIDAKKCLVTLKHTEKVYIVYLNSNLSIAITITESGVIHIWDTKCIKLIKRIPQDGKIKTIKEIKNDRYIILEGENNITILDLLNLEIIEKIDKFTIRLLKKSHGKYTYQINNDYDIIIHNTKSNNTIKLTGHKDTINDLLYLDKTQTLVTCSKDNSIIIWNTKNGKKSNSIDILNPLLIRTFNDNNLFVVNKIKKNEFNYSLLCMETMTITRILVLLIPVSNEYQIYDTKVHFNKNGIIIITTLIDGKCNKIWAVAYLPFVTTRIGGLEIHISHLEPIRISDNKILILIENKLVVLNLNKEKVKNISVYKDEISYLGKDSFTNNLILGFKSGKCIIYQIGAFLSLKEFLLLEKLKECRLKKTVLKYEDKNNVIFKNNIFFNILATTEYREESEEYLNHNRIKERARALYHKSLKELGAFEICKLYGHEYLITCE